MCNCIKQKENMIREVFIKEESSDKEIKSVTISGKSLMLDSEKVEISIPVYVYYDKNKRGYRKDYKLSTKYCPFCGEKQ